MLKNYSQYCSLIRELFFSQKLRSWLGFPVIHLPLVQSKFLNKSLVHRSFKSSVHQNSFGEFGSQARTESFAMLRIWFLTITPQAALVLTVMRLQPFDQIIV